LPDIEIRSNDIEISYEVSDSSVKQARDLRVFLKNNSKEFKKVTFIVDNSPNFVITGSVKKKVLIYPNERKELSFCIIPLYYGNLKLPPFKVIEESINYNSNQTESDKKQIYLIPDLMSVSGISGN
jgi:hypothetical protein